MPATRVQVSSGSGVSPVHITFLSPVVVGHLIVVAVGTFFTGDFTATDSLGNTYNFGARTDNTGGFSNTKLLYAIVTTGGTCTVAVAYTGSGGVNFTVGCAEYSGAGDYVQGACALGHYPVTIVGPNAVALMTTAMPTADSLILTCMTNEGDITGFQADSGDTDVVIINNVALFENFISGASQAKQSKIQTISIGAGPTTSICAICFSKSQARIGGMTAQYAIEPGMGFKGGIETAPSDGSIIAVFPDDGGTQSNIRCNLAYNAQIGNLLVVCIEQDIFNPGLAVSDDYGNMYSLIVTDASQGVAVFVYYSIIAHLPTAGKVFVVKVAISGGGGTPAPYQTPGIVLAEYRIRLREPPAGVAWLSNTPSGGDTIMATSPLAVLENDLLFSLASVAAFSGDTVVWTEQELYTIREKWQDAQSSSAITNQSRLALLAIEDKFALTDGSFDGEILVNRNPPGGLGMLLVSFPIVPPPTITACPLGTATVGIPYSSSFTVTGGASPFTYSIISGMLPPGLSLDPSTGIISGTPAAASSYAYTGQVTDVIDRTSNITCTITVSSQSLAQACTGSWELRRVDATFVPAPRIPVRGS